MSAALYEIAEQFYNWLFTGNNADAPADAGAAPAPPPPPPPVNVAPRAIPGNLAAQIINDPGGRAIRQRAAASPLNAGAVPFPPPPPLNGLNVINMNLAAPAISLEDELRSPEVRALRLRAHVRARQGDHGHILSRHAPTLTDQQLQDRLLTGLDHEGEPAPTSGVSSRFASEALFFSSLQTVHHELAKALRKTRTLLASNLQMCAAAEALFLNTPAGPAKHSAQLGRTEAYNDLRLAIVANNGLGDHLPVQWDANNRCVILYPRYAVSLYHAAQLGAGFYGTGPRPNVVVNGQPPKGAGKQKTMQLYARVQPFAGPTENTLTVFVTPDAPFNALGRQQNIESWGLITHYPQNDPRDKIEITGSN